MPRLKTVPSTSQLSMLRERVNTCFGRKIHYMACEELSERVFGVTRQRLSVSTLRRTLGLMRSTSVPAPATLDILSQYCGFTDFSDFSSRLSSSVSDTSATISPKAVWERARGFSETTMQSIRFRSVLPFGAMVRRSFAEAHLRAFLASNCVATAFVAAGGYGKTTALALLAEGCWLGEAPERAGDCCLLAEASACSMEAMGGLSPEGWVAQQLGFPDAGSLRTWFDSYWQQSGGYLVLLLDGVGDGSSVTATMAFCRELADWIARGAGLPWLKIVITCRTHVWGRYFLPILRERSNASLWYGIGLEVYLADYANVPLLTAGEIGQVLQQQLPGADEESPLHRLSPSFSQLLGIPFYLQLFVQALNNPASSLRDELSLIRNFFEEKVWNASYGEEKEVLLEALLQACQYGRAGDMAVKKDLLSLIKLCPEAYEELLSFGVLREEKVRNKYGTSTWMVRFSHENLFEVYTALQLVREHGTLDFLLMEKVCRDYAGQSLHVYLLRWLVLLAFEQGEYELLRQVFDLSLSLRPGDYPYLDLMELNQVIGLRLRWDREARTALIPYYAQHPVAQTHYFEQFVDIDYLVKSHGSNMEYYLRSKEIPEAQLFGHCLLFLRSFLAKDQLACARQYREIVAVPISNSIHPLPLGRRNACLLLWEHFYQAGISTALQEEIFRTEQQMPRKGDLLRNFPCYHLYLLEGL